jgi:hypothetical protein
MREASPGLKIMRLTVLKIQKPLHVTFYGKTKLEEKGKHSIHVFTEYFYFTVYIMYRNSMSIKSEQR